MADQTPVSELEGRELDVAVHREVFDHEVTRTSNSSPSSSPGSTALEYRDETGALVPHYSSNIAAAWKVVGEATAADFDLQTDGTWRVRCWMEASKGYAEAPTAPLAICRAALRAVRSQD